MRNQLLLLLAASATLFGGCADSEEPLRQPVNRLITGDAEPGPFIAVIEYLLREVPEAEGQLSRLRIHPSMPTTDMTVCRGIPCPDEAVVEVRLPDSVLEALPADWPVILLKEPVPFCPGEFRIGFMSYQVLHTGTTVVTARFGDTRIERWRYMDEAVFLVDSWWPQPDVQRHRVVAMAEGYTPEVELLIADCPAAEP
jgi:hypothetical protein